MYDQDNKIIKLCAQGMGLEGEGKNEEALLLFQQAWDEAGTDFEKFTAAHYVARHQKTILDKLKWDETALNLALNVNDENVRGAYPSLYLNLGKGYEDLKDFENARKFYKLAFSFINNLSDDGYGKMVKGAITNGLERVK